MIGICRAAEEVFDHSNHFEHLAHESEYFLGGCRPGVGCSPRDTSVGVQVLAGAGAGPMSRSLLVERRGSQPHGPPSSADPACPAHPAPRPGSDEDPELPRHRKGLARSISHVSLGSDHAGMPSSYSMAQLPR